MNDISKCTGENCKVKENCKRFTDKSELNQSWILGKWPKNGKCFFYWKNNETN